MEILRPTHLWIDTEQLQSNYQSLQQRLGPKAFLCPMIKANAYGHGDLIVAASLAQVGCRWLGVASVEEGAHLRANGITTGILVFGFYGRAAVRSLLDQKLIPVVSDMSQLEDLRQEAREPVGIHLKWNTGMNRLGFQSHETEQVQALLDRAPQIQVLGMGTHLHTGEDLLKPQSSAQGQIDLFKQILGRLKGVGSAALHVYNSAAMTALQQSQKELEYGARPGLLTYGVAPEGFVCLSGIKPVLSFRSQIVALQPVRKGEVVSYAGTWQAPRDSRIAVIPAGYGDGISRSLSDRGEVLIRGRRAPIRGRVCMDYTMVDVTDFPETELRGETVTFIGQQGSEELTVNQVAEMAQRSPYEILTSISERVPRLSSQGVF